MARRKKIENVDNSGFDPAIHCGAGFRPFVGGKNPCQQPKGEDGGYCQSHRNKRKGSGAPGAPLSAIPTSGSKLRTTLYDKVLSPNEKEYHAEIRQLTPDQILAENFYYSQARYYGLIARQGELTKQGKALMRACAILVDEGQLTEEFVMELRSTLLKFSPREAVDLFNSTIPLAQASHALGKNATASQQASMLADFLIFALTSTDLQAIKQNGLQVMQRLKLDAGVDIEELRARYGIVDDEPVAEGEDDPEGLEGDGDEPESGGAE